MHEFNELPEEGWQYPPAIPAELPPGTECIGVDPALVVEEDLDAAAPDSVPEDEPVTDEAAVPAELPAAEEAARPAADAGVGGDVPPPGDIPFSEAAADTPEPFGVERFDGPEFADDTPADYDTHVEKTATVLAEHEPYVDTYEDLDGEHEMVALEHRSEAGTVYVKVAGTGEMRLSFMPASGEGGASHTYRADAAGVVRRYDDVEVPHAQTPAEQLAGDDLVFSTALPEGKIVGATELEYIHGVVGEAMPTHVTFPELVDAIMLGNRPVDGSLVEESLASPAHAIDTLDQVALDLVSDETQRFAYMRGDGSLTSMYGRTTLGSDGGITAASVTLYKHGESIVGVSIGVITERAARPDLPATAAGASDAVRAGTVKPYEFPYCSLRCFGAFGRTQPYVVCDMTYGQDANGADTRFNISLVAARMLRNHLRGVA